MTSPGRVTRRDDDEAIGTVVRGFSGDLFGVEGEPGHVGLGTMGAIGAFEAHRNVDADLVDPRANQVAGARLNDELEALARSHAQLGRS